MDQRLLSLNLQRSIVKIEILVSDSCLNLYLHPSVMGMTLFSPPCEHTHLFLVLEEKAGDWRGDHTHTQHSPALQALAHLRGSSLRAQLLEAWAASSWQLCPQHLWSGQHAQVLNAHVWANIHTTQGYSLFWAVCTEIVFLWEMWDTLRWDKCGRSWIKKKKIENPWPRKRRRKEKSPTWLASVTVCLHLCHDSF